MHNALSFDVELHTSSMLLTACYWVHLSSLDGIYISLLSANQTPLSFYASVAVSFFQLHMHLLLVSHVMWTMNCDCRIFRCCCSCWCVIYFHNFDFELKSETSLCLTPSTNCPAPTQWQVTSVNYLLIYITTVVPKCSLFAQPTSSSDSTAACALF